MKICSKCGEEKSLSEYNFRKESQKYRNECKQCQKEFFQQYYLNNTNKFKQYKKDFVEKNPKYMKNYRKRYRAKNRTRLIEESAKYLEENRDKIKTEVKRRRKTEVCYKLRKVISHSISKALKDYKRKLTHIELLGCTIQEFKIYIENQLEDWMSWDNYGSETWHIDHIKPISHYDLSDPEEQKACFHYSNTQPLSAFDNRSKKNRFVG